MKYVGLLALLTCCVEPTLPVQTPVVVEQTYELSDRYVHVKEADPPKLAPRRILIIGDSEACAVAGQTKNVKMPLDAVVTDCKGGTTVDYWGSGGNFKAALQRYLSPDTVVIFLGTNHYWDVRTPNVKPILDIIKGHGLNCVWVGNTAVKEKHWRINYIIRDAVSPTCDYFDTEAANIPLWDGVHPDGPAALKWLSMIWPMIPMKYEE